MTTAKIIRIDPIPKFFSITWMLGARCNYECMYCPADLHDKTSAHHDLDTLKSLWQQVVERTQHLGLDYKLSLTGGEITTNKNLVPFLEWIVEKFASTQVFVSSNGSASLNYYRKLAALVSGISLSTHSEFMDEKKFFLLANDINQIMIRPQKSLHVCIMDEYWNQERIQLYKEFCDKNQISYSVNPINYDKKVRMEVWKQGKANIDNV